jgi:hypothetical protein
MSTTPYTPQTPPESSGYNSLKISAVLNPSGLPTPDATPIQETIQEPSQDLSSQHSIDPTVVPNHNAVEEQEARLSLFPTAPSAQDVTEHITISNNGLSPSLYTPQSIGATHSRIVIVERIDVDATNCTETRSFEELSEEEWIACHQEAQVLSEVATSSKSHNDRNIAFRSTMWTSASQNPDAYSQMLNTTNSVYIYGSGLTREMDVLSEVCATAKPLPTSVTATRARRGPATTARRSSAAESRPATSRRASTNKRKSTEDGPEAKRMRAAAVKKEKPLRYEEVVNYCPPLNTLKVNAVKPFVQKGNRIDLSTDVDIRAVGAELCELEVKFAEMNQLDINKYLINKRKIFEGRVRHHISGHKAFTKTHAQTAGIIDVNKASRMWEFYDQAGWLDMSHFKKFIPRELEEMQKSNLQIAKEFL